MPGQRVEGAERLVEQHQLRLPDQRPGERDPLTLAAGQRHRPRARVVAQPDLAQCLQAPLLQFGPATGARLQADHDIAQHLLPGQQPGLLEHHGPAFRHERIAGVVGVEAAENAQQRALPAAAATQQRHEFAGSDGEVERA